MSKDPNIVAPNPALNGLEHWDGYAFYKLRTRFLDGRQGHKPYVPRKEPYETEHRPFRAHIGTRPIEGKYDADGYKVREIGISFRDQEFAWLGVAENGVSISHLTNAPEQCILKECTGPDKFNWQEYKY